MSGIKPNGLQWFYRSLHKRTGTVTWRKIERSGLLTAEELRLLGRDVPRGTNSHIEKSLQEVA